MKDKIINTIKHKIKIKKRIKKSLKKYIGGAQPENKAKSVRDRLRAKFMEKQKAIEKKIVEKKVEHKKILIKEDLLKSTSEQIQKSNENKLKHIKKKLPHEIELRQLYKSYNSEHDSEYAIFNPNPKNIEIPLFYKNKIVPTNDGIEKSVSMLKSNLDKLRKIKDEEDLLNNILLIIRSKNSLLDKKIKLIKNV